MSYEIGGFSLFFAASATYQMKQLRCDSIGWVRVGPSKGSGSLIVGFDVAHEFATQVGHGCEDSTGITWR